MGSVSYSKSSRVINSVICSARSLTLSLVWADQLRLLPAVLGHYLGVSTEPTLFPPGSLKAIYGALKTKSSFVLTFWIFWSSQFQYKKRSGRV